MTWTTEQKTVVRAMWESGKSASEIGRHFNTTRGAISGLCDRNGWITPNKQGVRRAKEPGERPKRSPASNLYRAVARRSSPTPQPPMEPDPEPTVDDLAIPLEQRKSVMELTDHTCRFPVGSPGEGGDLFFCGAEPLTGKPYCGPHFRRTRAPQRIASRIRFIS